MNADDPGGTGAPAGPDGPDATGDPAVVDCRGQRCPLPVITLARELAALPPGAVLRVLADDPAAATDIPAWCRLRGQEFLGTVAVPGGTGYDVRRAGD